MTPAQRLAHALYGSYDPERVQEARYFAKRLKESGFAIVPEEATDAMHHAYTEAADDIDGPAAMYLQSDAYSAAIQAYQQEIEKP